MTQPREASQPRTAAPLAEFVRMDAIGAALIGRVEKFAKNANGDFAVFAPAVFKSNSGEQFAKYGELALGLNADLRAKMTDADVGKFVLVYFVATRPTANKPAKLYNVVELTPEEAGHAFKHNKLAPAWVQAPANLPASNGAAPVVDPFA